MNFLKLFLAHFQSLLMFFTYEAFLVDLEYLDGLLSFLSMLTIDRLLCDSLLLREGLLVCSIDLRRSSRLSSFFLRV